MTLSQFRKMKQVVAEHSVHLSFLFTLISAFTGIISSVIFAESNSI